MQRFTLLEKREKKKVGDPYAQLITADTVVGISTIIISSWMISRRIEGSRRLRQLKSFAFKPNRNEITQILLDTSSRSSRLPKHQRHDIRYTDYKPHIIQSPNIIIHSILIVFSVQKSQSADCTINVRNVTNNIFTNTFNYIDSDIKVVCYSSASSLPPKTSPPLFWQ